MTRKFVLHMFVSGGLILILATSFTRLATESGDRNVTIPFPGEYESWARVDSVPEVAFPEGYRSWTHVKSVVDLPSGFHHIYANTLAMEGYRTGTFVNGSIIVVDFLQMIDNKSRIDEGTRRYVDVMVKDTMNYESTGGWGFEEFDGSSKTIRKVTQAKASASCYVCHTKRAANDFVFSEYRE